MIVDRLPAVVVVVELGAVGAEHPDVVELDRVAQLGRIAGAVDQVGDDQTGRRLGGELDRRLAGCGISRRCSAGVGLGPGGVVEPALGVDLGVVDRELIGDGASAASATAGSASALPQAASASGRGHGDQRQATPGIASSSSFAGRCDRDDVDHERDRIARRDEVTGALVAVGELGTGCRADADRPS